MLHSRGARRVELRGVVALSRASRPRPRPLARPPHSSSTPRRTRASGTRPSSVRRSASRATRRSPSVNKVADDEGLAQRMRACGDPRHARRPRVAPGRDHHAARRARGSATAMGFEDTAPHSPWAPPPRAHMRACARPSNCSRLARSRRTPLTSARGSSATSRGSPESSTRQTRAGSRMTPRCTASSRPHTPRTPRVRSAQPTPLQRPRSPSTTQRRRAWRSTRR